MTGTISNNLSNNYGKYNHQSNYFAQGNVTDTLERINYIPSNVHTFPQEENQSF